MEPLWDKRMNDVLTHNFDKDVVAGYMRGLRHIHAMCKGAALETRLDDIPNRLKQILAYIHAYASGSDSGSGATHNAQMVLFMYHLSFAIPSIDAINFMIEIIDDKKVVEIYSGRGLWAFFLKTMKIDIRATNNTAIALDNTFTHVEKVDTREFLSRNKNSVDILLVIRPDLHDQRTDKYTDETIECLKVFEGKGVFYVGHEYDTVRNQPDRVFVALEELFVCCDIMDIPTWTEFPRDHIMYYQKKDVPYNTSKK